MIRQKSLIRTMRQYVTTIGYLKPVQVRHLIKYRLRAVWRSLSGYTYPLSVQPPQRHRETLSSLPTRSGLYNDSTFHIYNLTREFSDEIDWEYEEYGRHWLYALNDFHFLQQSDLGIGEGLKLIRDFISKTDNGSIGMEPYPLSKRCLNWIKFLSLHKISDEHIDQSLYAQLLMLTDNLEYHLLGNHLIENGCALLAGGIFFNDQDLTDRGMEILTAQLSEQILFDGAHYERSPMYHALVLESLLDCLNISVNYSSRVSGNEEQQIAGTCRSMLDWLHTMTFPNGDIPHFNDSVAGVALTADELEAYLERITDRHPDLAHTPGTVGIRSLTELDSPTVSGYKRYAMGEWVCILDAGNIGPDVQPGHAHSDTLNFALYVSGHPIIVDRGVSTYEDEKLRYEERQTSSHNTFRYGEYEQSDIWSRFRIGKRAYCQIVSESVQGLTAEHNGYSRFGITSQREFQFESSRIEWVDKFIGRNTEAGGTGFLHFHPDVSIEGKEDSIISDLFSIEFEGADSIGIENYSFCQGFNKRVDAIKLVIDFKERLTTRFTLNRKF